MAYAGHWEVPMSSVKLSKVLDGSEEEEFALSENSFGIVDSGTSYVLMPSADMAKLMAYFQARGVYCWQLEMGRPICYCGLGLRAFPDFRFTLGGKDYFLPKESYVTKADLST